MRRFKIRLYGYSDQVKPILDKVLLATVTAKDDPRFQAMYGGHVWQFDVMAPVKFHYLRTSLADAI